MESNIPYLYNIKINTYSSGIGRSVAILFAREGCDVTIVHLPEEMDDANETKSLVEREGRKCFLVPLDLTDFDAAKKVVDQHIEAFGSLDILVNNASRQVFCKDVAEIDMSTVSICYQISYY